MQQLTPRTAAELFGAGDPPRNTREKLLHQAIELFYLYGFHAVGLDHLLAQVQVTKTTFYNHFESKDHLVIEALKLRDQWEGAAFMRQVEAIGGKDPRARLLAIFDVLDTWFNHPDYRGCLFMNASAEFPLPSDPVHQAAAASYLSMREKVYELARLAGAEQPDDIADTWMLLIEGSFARRLIEGNNLGPRQARPIAEMMLKGKLPKAKTRRSSGSSRK